MTPWLEDHIVKARSAELDAVRAEVQRIHESCDRLGELLPATGRNKKHIKELRFHADRLEMQAQIRIVA